MTYPASEVSCSICYWCRACHALWLQQNGPLHSSKRHNFIVNTVWASLELSSLELFESRSRDPPRTKLCPLPSLLTFTQYWNIGRLSLFAEPFGELKFSLRLDLRQKVKWFRWDFRWVETSVTSVLDRSFDSVKVWDEKYGLTVACEFTEWQGRRGVRTGLGMSNKRVKLFMLYLARGGYYHQLGHDEGLSQSLIPELSWTLV